MNLRNNTKGRDKRQLVMTQTFHMHKSEDFLVLNNKRASQFMGRKQTAETHCFHCLNPRAHKKKVKLIIVTLRVQFFSCKRNIKVARHNSSHSQRCENCNQKNLSPRRVKQSVTSQMTRKNFIIAQSFSLKFI